MTSIRNILYRAEENYGIGKLMVMLVHAFACYIQQMADTNKRAANAHIAKLDNIIQPMESAFNMMTPSDINTNLLERYKSLLAWYKGMRTETYGIMMEANIRLFPNLGECEEFVEPINPNPTDSEKYSVPEDSSDPMGTYFLPEISSYCKIEQHELVEMNIKTSTTMTRAYICAVAKPNDMLKYAVRVEEKNNNRLVDCVKLLLSRFCERMGMVVKLTDIRDIPGSNDTTIRVEKPDRGVLSKDYEVFFAEFTRFTKELHMDAIINLIKPLETIGSQHRHLMTCCMDKDKYYDSVPRNGILYGSGNLGNLNGGVQINIGNIVYGNNSGTMIGTSLTSVTPQQYIDANQPITPFKLNDYYASYKNAIPKHESDVAFKKALRAKGYIPKKISDGRMWVRKSNKDKI